MPVELKLKIQAYNQQNGVSYVNTSMSTSPHSDQVKTIDHSKLPRYQFPQIKQTKGPRIVVKGESSLENQSGLPPLND